MHWLILVLAVVGVIFISLLAVGVFYYTLEMAIDFLNGLRLDRARINRLMERMEILEDEKLRQNIGCSIGGLKKSDEPQ